MEANRILLGGKGGLRPLGKTSRRTGRKHTNQRESSRSSRGNFEESSTRDSERSRTSRHVAEGSWGSLYKTEGKRESFMSDGGDLSIFSTMLRSPSTCSRVSHPSPVAMPPPKDLKPSNSPALKPFNSPALKPPNSPALKPPNSPALKPSNSPALKPSNSPALKPSNSPALKSPNSSALKPPNSPALKPPNSSALKPPNSPDDAVKNTDALKHEQAKESGKYRMAELVPLGNMWDSVIAWEGLLLQSQRAKEDVPSKTTEQALPRLPSIPCRSLPSFTRKGLRSRDPDNGEGVGGATKSSRSFIHRNSKAHGRRGSAMSWTELSSKSASPTCRTTRSVWKSEGNSSRTSKDRLKIKVLKTVAKHVERRRVRVAKQFVSFSSDFVMDNRIRSKSKVALQAVESSSRFRKPSRSKSTFCPSKSLESLQLSIFPHRSVPPTRPSTNGHVSGSRSFNTSIHMSRASSNIRGLNSSSTSNRPLLSLSKRSKLRERTSTSGPLWR
ncbi:hypothetical protein AAMO2058_001194100 [Amorphochlora amoebiformis]